MTIKTKTIDYKNDYNQDDKTIKTTDFIQLTFE